MNLTSDQAREILTTSPLFTPGANEQLIALLGRKGEVTTDEPLISECTGNIVNLQDEDHNLLGPLSMALTQLALEIIDLRKEVEDLRETGFPKLVGNLDNLVLGDMVDQCTFVPFRSEDCPLRDIESVPATKVCVGADGVCSGYGGIVKKGAEYYCLCENLV